MTNSERNLKKLVDFVALTGAFREVERDIPLSREQRLENDAEHSYQLAIVAWYIATIEKANLDTNKILKYALVHDLVEVYAGDTPLYSSDNRYLKSKEKRERSAAVLLRKRFSDFKELNNLIRAYRRKGDRESRFIYATDKLLPILSIYLDNGYGWRSHRITPDMIIDKNGKRVSASRRVKKYFDILMDVIQEKPELFK